MKLLVLMALGYFFYRSFLQPFRSISTKEPKQMREREDLKQTKFGETEGEFVDYEEID